MSLQGGICKYVDIFHFDYLFFRVLPIKINTMGKVPATAAERKKNQREKMKKTVLIRSTQISKKV